MEVTSISIRRKDGTSNRKSNDAVDTTDAGLPNGSPSLLLPFSENIASLFPSRNRRHEDEQQQVQDDDGTMISSVSAATMTTSGFFNNRHTGEAMKRLNHLDLFGRDSQLKQLKTIFQRVSQEQQSHTVMIHGPSGTGKTALAESLVGPFCNEAQGYFVTGKFDLLRQNDNYSAIASALSDLTEVLLQTQDPIHFYQRLQEEFGASAPNDLPVLAQLISSLHQLTTTVSNHNQNHTAQDGASKSTSKAQGNPAGSSSLGHDLFNAASVASPGGGAMTHQGGKRLQALCQKFLRAIDRPVCLFLDDVHNSDDESLELIRALATDSQAKQLLIICTYRDDEGEQAEHVHQAIVSGGGGGGGGGDNESTNGGGGNNNNKKVPMIRNLTNMPVGNLSVEAVQDMLMGTFEGRLDNVHDLAQLIHRKTHANAFHMVQFLRQLIETGLLKRERTTSAAMPSQDEQDYNADEDIVEDDNLDTASQVAALPVTTNTTTTDSDYHWTYDLDRISHDTNVSDNVVEIVADQISMLPPDTQDVLLLAAFYNFRFSKSLMQDMIHFVHQRQGRRLDPDAFQYSFEIALHQGLIERGHGETYKFTHDRVQEALYGMVHNFRQKACIHLLLGQFAQSLLEKQEEEMQQQQDGAPTTAATTTATAGTHDSLFMAARQMNLGMELIRDEGQLHQVVALNVRAAKVAITRSAYHSAKTFLQHGIDGLKQSNRDRWSDANYDLSLDLFSTAAQVFSCLGYYDECDRMVKEVLINGHTLVDKSRAILADIQGYGYRNCCHEGMQAIVTVLHNEYGVRFPAKPSMLNVGKELLHTMYQMRGQDILKLPDHQNEAMRTAQRLLVIYGVYAFFVNDDVGLTIAWLMATRLTLKYGMSDLAPQAFAAYGMIMSATGSIDEGYRVCKLAQVLLGRCESKRSQPFMSLLSGLWCWHWKIPLGELLDDYEQSWQVGIHIGEVQVGFYCALSWSVVAFYCGLPLTVGVKKSKEYALYMDEFKQDATLVTMLPYCQGMQNLSGHDIYYSSSSPSEAALTLDGGIIEDYDDFVYNAEQTGNAAAIQSALLVRLQIYYLFGYYEGARRMVTELKPLESTLAGHVELVVLKFWAGMTHAMLYRQNPQKKKYLQKAKRMERLIFKWHEGGNPNCKPMSLLLEAELMSCSNKKSNKKDHDATVLRKYQDAATAARDIGLLQYQGLAYELAAQHQMNMSKRQNVEAAGEGGNDDNEGDAQLNLESARKCYLKWNAYALVQCMEIKHGNLLLQQQQQQEQPQEQPREQPADTDTTGTESTAAWSGLA